MEIEFNHPPTGTIDPFNKFNPKESAHYPVGNAEIIPAAGIYIYGLKLKMDKIERFAPLYVGISNNLKNRLFNHHYSKTIKGNGNKDLWSFLKGYYSLKEIHKRYNEMFYYDYINNNRKSNINRVSEVYMKELNMLKHLIYFQNKNYFNLKYNLPFEENLSDSEREINHSAAMNIFPYIRSDITKMISIFEKNFYYVYARMDKHVKIDQNDSLRKNYPLFNDINHFGSKREKADGYKLAELIEGGTKKALNLIGLHTTAKAEGKIIDMDIDLSKIQNELINLGEHSYNVSGKYIDSLKIIVRK